MKHGFEGSPDRYCILSSYEAITVTMTVEPGHCQCMMGLLLFFSNSAGMVSRPWTFDGRVDRGTETYARY